jgi:hypothetical protein
MNRDILLEVCKYLNPIEQIIFSQTCKNYYKFIKRAHKKYRFVCFDDMQYTYKVSIFKTYHEANEYINERINLIDDVFDITWTIEDVKQCKTKYPQIKKYEIQMEQYKYCYFSKHIKFVIFYLKD